MRIVRFMVAVGVAGLILGGSITASSGADGDFFSGFLRQLTAPSVSFWSHDGWNQWHPQRGRGILAATGTQCFFCKGNLNDGDGDGVIDLKDRCLGTPLGSRVDVHGCKVTPEKEPVVETPAVEPVWPRSSVTSHDLQGDSDGDGIRNGADQCPQTVRGVDVDERGCWSIPPILFKTRDWRIQPRAAKTLKAVAAILADNPTVKISIQGHADQRPTSEDRFNIRLGERRSNTVFDYLVIHGADPALLSTISFGYHRPVASNGTREGRRKNRRVQLKVVP